MNEFFIASETGIAVVSFTLCIPLIVLYCSINEVIISGKLDSLFLLQSSFIKVWVIFEILSLGYRINNFIFFICINNGAIQHKNKFPALLTN